MEDIDARQRLCRGAQEFWLRSLVVGDGGLMTMEVGRRRYLVTPLGRRRSSLSPQDILWVDVGGADPQQGSSLPTDLWRPHRLAYQSGRDDAASNSGGWIHATALLTPAAVMALALLQPQAKTLELPGLSPLPAVEAQDETALRSALETQPAILLRGMGLLAVGPTLETVQNIAERVEHAAMIAIALRAGK